MCCQEEGGKEVDADTTDGCVVVGCDGHTQTSDSKHSDDELGTCSLSDSISNWAIQFGISLVALTVLLGKLPFFPF